MLIMKKDNNISIAVNNMKNDKIPTKVIVNPESNPRVLKRYLKSSLRILREGGFKPSVTFSRAPGEVYPLAKQATTQGYKTMIVVGGDGSTNEAINGIVGTDIPLGLLPIGGSNVLARELGVPMNMLEAARVIVRRNKRRIDLGCIDGRYFSMMASCGYDAYAISRTSMKVKKVIRRYAYLWAGIKDFLGYHPTVIDLVLDNGKVVENGTFVVVSNTHFYGGTHQMTPFAEIDDGFLDLCIYKGKTQIGLVRFAFQMLWRQHLNMKNVRYYRVRRVEMNSAKRTFVQVDGDMIGELPMTSWIVPGAIEIFC
jgi:YegS/Rv2252/BmrU family lipid kinase